MAGKPDSVTEETYEVQLGSGIYTSELASNIPDGFSPICYNLIATGDSLENRPGVRFPSVDWKVQHTVESYQTSEYSLFPLAPFGNDSSQPALAWASRGTGVPSGVLQSNLNLIRASGTTDANDGFMSVNIHASFAITGIAQYNGTIYFALNSSGIKKITAINWATDAVTYAAVASSPTVAFGLISFKDRLWAIEGATIKFTDLASIGGLPETWNTASNSIPIVGSNGHAQVLKLVPLGNKLGIFTTNGFFTLLVEGEPQSWILRQLDSKSICTTSECALESKGVIYYVNTEGVWATNLLTTTKLSGVIEDQFFLAKGLRRHKITLYEDGLIVSIAKVVTSAGVLYNDKENSRIFYSKLDPIAWTEWNINRHGFMGVNNYQYVSLSGFSPKVPTYLNTDPVVYGFVSATDGTESAVQNTVTQLIIMDGGGDSFTTRGNVQETIAVGIYLKTKNFDAGNAIRIKWLKEAYLELYTSDAEHELETSWDMDSTTSIGTEIRTTILNDFTVGLGSNILRFPADFRFRRAALNLRTELQSSTSQIKVKTLTTIVDTGRKVVEVVG